MASLEDIVVTCVGEEETSISVLLPRPAAGQKKTPAFSVRLPAMRLLKQGVKLGAKGIRETPRYQCLAHTLLTPLGSVGVTERL
jgi:hypothetical protein